MLGRPAVGHSEFSVSAGALISGDDQQYRWDQYQLGLRHAAPDSGAWLALRFHTYSLSEELTGILPFDGSEPALELGGHLLLDELWWLGASAGLQGTADLDGAIGSLIVARAIPTQSGTFTPRLELAREPLARTALPLSLGLTSYRAEALLAWRNADWTAEGGVRGDLWESDTVPARTRNLELDTIESTRVATLHAYVLTDSAHWFDAGLAGKVAWSGDNTLLPTQLVPVRAYNWYPASAPPFLWETALVLRASGHVIDALEASLQAQLPLLSQETRQWETLRQTYWGTAPLEAKLDAKWAVFSSTTLALSASLFAKPWERWDVISREAYRMASAQLSIEQRI